MSKSIQDTYQFILQEPFGKNLSKKEVQGQMDVTLIVVVVIIVFALVLVLKIKK